MAKQILYKGKKIERRFTPAWGESGNISFDLLPQLASSAISQRKNMIEYIEALHDEFDRILAIVNSCDESRQIFEAYRSGVKNGA